ncbi:MAG: zinc ribbon domain-containing protein [Clostridia bacterium]|nr:zinc ribbon domain-containing protein [Clostridia bacterium]
MEKDVFYYLAADVPAVYTAYLNAACGDKFRAQCWQEPYSMLSFPLKFSFKYNMNGGTCFVRFIPAQGGTSVCIHFSILQLVGAMYKKCASDLTAAASAFLGIPAQEVVLDAGLFTNPANQVRMQQPAQPVPSQVSVQPAKPEPPRYANDPVPPRLCTACGAQLSTGAVFCTVCGTKYEAPVSPAARFCSVCGAQQLDGEAVFCVSCGAKI